MNKEKIEISKVAVEERWGNIKRYGVIAGAASAFTAFVALSMPYGVPNSADMKSVARDAVRQNVSLSVGKTAYLVESQGVFGCGGGMVHVRANVPKGGKVEEGVKKVFTVFESFSKGPTSCEKEEFKFELRKGGEIVPVGKIKETLRRY